MAQVLLNHNASPSFSVHSRVAIARHQHSQAETGFHKSSHCMYNSTRVCHKTNLVRLGGWKWDRNHYLLKFIAEHQWSPQFLCLAAYLPTFPGGITANQVCSSWQFSILSVSCVLSKHLFNISPPIMYIPDIPEWFLCKKKSTSFYNWPRTYLGFIDKPLLYLWQGQRQTLCIHIPHFITDKMSFLCSLLNRNKTLFNQTF